MVHVRKRFGQHFLADSMVIGSLLRAINPSEGDRILEIGPGRGAISRHLAQLEDVDYVGVEIDRDLVAFLREKYPDINIHSEDILKADLEQILEVENNSERAGLPDIRPCAAGSPAVSPLRATGALAPAPRAPPAATSGRARRPRGGAPRSPAARACTPRSGRRRR